MARPDASTVDAFKHRANDAGFQPRGSSTISPDAVFEIGM